MKKIIKDSSELIGNTPMLLVNNIDTGPCNLYLKLEPADEDLLFPSRKNPKNSICIRTAWNTTLKRAEIENFRFHDLRHCTGSYLAMNGASPIEIADVLGHKTLEMVKRYSHISQDHRAAVLEKMNKKVLDGG